MNPEPTYPRIIPVGEAAVTVEFGNRIHPDLNCSVYALETALHALTLPWIEETVPSYRSLLIYFNPQACNQDELREQIQSILPTLQCGSNNTGRLIEIPTIYGGIDGPDLTFVADYNKLSIEDVITIHSAVDYPVYMMGFTPGFPYLGGMDPRIASPRLATPREKVAAGSVGIAGSQTGIYSLNSPGGWRIIGRTHVKLFDPAQDHPFLLAPGDRLRFIPVISSGDSE